VTTPAVAIATGIISADMTVTVWLFTHVYAAIPISIDLDIVE
jgi:hypothetical protein